MAFSDNLDIEPQGRPGGHRARLAAWLETAKVRNTIIALIIVNAITLGLATSDRIVDATGGWLAVFDDIVIAIFVVEMVLKLYAYGLRFFYSAWNWFDLIIVTISLVPATENPNRANPRQPAPSVSRVRTAKHEHASEHCDSMPRPQHVPCHGSPA